MEYTKLNTLYCLQKYTNGNTILWRPWKRPKYIAIPLCIVHCGSSESGLYNTEVWTGYSFKTMKLNKSWKKYSQVSHVNCHVSPDHNSMQHQLIWKSHAVWWYNCLWLVGYNTHFLTKTELFYNFLGGILKKNLFN